MKTRKLRNLTLNPLLIPLLILAGCIQLESTELDSALSSASSGDMFGGGINSRPTINVSKPNGEERPPEFGCNSHEDQIAELKISLNEDALENFERIEIIRNQFKYQKDEVCSLEDSTFFQIQEDIEQICSSGDDEQTIENSIKSLLDINKDELDEERLEMENCFRENQEVLSAIGDTDKELHLACFGEPPMPPKLVSADDLNENLVTSECEEKIGEEHENNFIDHTFIFTKPWNLCTNGSKSRWPWRKPTNGSRSISKW